MNQEECISLLEQNKDLTIGTDSVLEMVQFCLLKSTNLFFSPCSLFTYLIYDVLQ